MSENSYGGPTEAEDFPEQAEPLFEEPVRTGSQGYEHEPPFAPAEPADESTEFGSSEGWGGTDLPGDDGSWEWDGPASDGAYLDDDEDEPEYADEPEEISADGPRSADPA